MSLATLNYPNFCCVILAPLLLCAPQQLPAQDSDDSLRVEVEGALRALRNASPCWEYEIHGITEIDRNSFPEGDDPIAGPDGELSFPPPKEMKSNARCLLDITNGRYRLETRGLIHSPMGWRERFEISVFDGTLALSLHPNVKEETGNQSLARWTMRPELIDSPLSMNPIFSWSCGILSGKDLVGKSESALQTTSGTWKSHEVRIIWQYETASMRTTWMFDRTLGCRVVGRILEYKTDDDEVRHPPMTDRVSYRTEDGRIMPDTWTCTHSATTRTEYKVTRAVALESIALAQFREPENFLQPGMLLIVDKKWVEVADDGSFLPFERPG